jgi:hypothetical protein
MICPIERLFGKLSSVIRAKKRLAETAKIAGKKKWLSG